MSIGLVDTLVLNRKRVSLGLVGTYVPQRCGIATFTKDVADAVLKQSPLNKVEVAALCEKDSNLVYPKEVKLKIAKDDFSSYFSAAEYFNKSDLMLVNLQHEFGIFGGEDGENILSFINALKKPVVTTLHTVLEKPASEHQQNILKEICAKSAAIIVMLPYAMKILNQVYGVPVKKIYVIPHGVPESNFFDAERIKKMLNLQDKKVLATFGLISRGKGLEYVIQALPEILKENPQVIYLVIGVTHPNVIRHEGEAYRDSLLALAQKLGVADKVIFINKFLDIEELVRYLLATDVYVVPYLGKDQISSGTLSYAIGCGKAIVSTPFIYAEEMLQQNRGLLVNFKDLQGISLAVNRIFADHDLRTELQENAYKFGRQMVWSSIGNDLATLFNRINRWQRWRNFMSVLQLRARRKISTLIVKGKNESEQVFRQTMINTMLFLRGYPSLSFDHVYRMTDETGIFQHANYSVPNKKEGYTLDDNARAMIMMIMKYQLRPEESIREYIYRYFSFVSYAYNGDGTFHNFMSFDRRWLDEKGSEDSIGRAIWALGFASYALGADPLGRAAEQLLRDVYAHLPRFNSLRAKSFAIIGLCFYYTKNKERADIKSKIIELSDHFVEAFEKNSRNNWQWFEPYLTYANGRLPHALLLSYAITGEKKYLEIAERSLAFLQEILIIDKKLIIVGNEEWYARDGRRSFYDQQPIDAGCMVEVFLAANLLTKKKKYYNLAKISFDWFFGENSLHKELVDQETGGCRDGLLADKVNDNEGSESTVAYIMAYLAMLLISERPDENIYASSSRKKG